MARPRKDAAEANARTRIIDAFWSSLERVPRSAMTVGAIVEMAQCNRGTFYYHFADLDVLASCAVREEFFSDDTLVLAIFGTLVNGDAQVFDRGVPALRLHRMSVAIRAGERQMVEDTVREEVQQRWQKHLCARGEELTPEARFAIQFMVGGVLGFISYMLTTGHAPNPLPPAERAYLASVARATLNAVADAQGLEPVEVLARVFCEDELNLPV